MGTQGRFERCWTKDAVVMPYNAWYNSPSSWTWMTCRPYTRNNFWLEDGGHGKEIRTYSVIVMRTNNYSFLSFSPFNNDQVAWLSTAVNERINHDKRIIITIITHLETFGVVRHGNDN